MLGQEVGGGIDGLGHGGDRAEEELHSSRTDARGRGRKLRWLVDGIWEDPEGDFGESGGGYEDGWDISLEVRVCPYLD